LIVFAAFGQSVGSPRGSQGRDLFASVAILLFLFGPFAGLLLIYLGGRRLEAWRGLRMFAAALYVIWAFGALLAGAMGTLFGGGDGIRV
jgi:hypothetical protein